MHPGPPVGSRIGSYEIVGSLGSGGMGEVYRARDPRLQREVALKVLPERFAFDPDRLARFEREARMLAALNHPHIAAIYGFEEEGPLRALVLELVEGPTLADLLAAGSLTLARALYLAQQIAAALEAAHARGIVHRDLKPANIKIAQGDVVKVLDFGIAKTWTGSATDAQHSTITAEGTLPGVVIGTAGYMSPEQARGAQIDHRSDVWAFGCVLFESLSGCRAFAGDRFSETLAKVLEAQPDWRALPPSTPTAIAQLIHRCLEKDAALRPAGMGEVRTVLARCQADPLAVSRARMRDAMVRLWPAAMIGVIAVSTLAAALWWLQRQRDAPPAVPQLVNPAQVSSAIGVEDYPTLSPDGRTVAYESPQADNWDIWLATIGGAAAVNRTADNPGDDRYPSWSPDGLQIAFWSSRDGARGFYLMPALGGPAAKIADAPYGNDFHQSPAAWSRDSAQLAFVAYQPVGSRFQVALHIITLATRAERTMQLPGSQESRLDLNWSHDGKYLAYLDIAQQPSELSRLMVVRLSDGTAEPLSDESLNIRSPFWSRDDRALLFVSNRAGTWDLWQVPLDDARRARGPQTRVTTGVDMLHAGLSVDGRHLVYAKGRWVSNAWRVPIRNDRVVTWKDAEQLTFDQAFVEFAQVSRDGQWLAFSSDRLGNQDLWKKRLPDGDLVQLTSHPAPDWAPYWSRDGKQLAFYSNRTGNREIFTMSADGGEPRQLTSTPGILNAGGVWSPNGTEIAYRSERLGSSDLWVTSVLDPRKSRVLAPSPAAEYGHAWSPDGKWIAFTSDRGGLRRLWRVPSAGGEPERLNDADTASPVYSLDGDTIYFPAGGARGPRNLWALTVATKQERRLSDFSRRRGTLCFQPINTDGKYLYFTWREDLGDIWVMDVK